MKLGRVSYTALLCVLFLGACQQGDKSDDNADSETSTDAEEEEIQPVPVETMSPVRGDIYATYTGTAAIEAFAEAEVIAKVDGEIRKLLVEEGDYVNANQVLVRLDGDRLRLELNESRARLLKLQRDHARNEELRNKGLISQGDYEKIQYDLEALQASFNLRSLELDYTGIRAPIAGVISERYVKLGNTIKTGDPVFRVTSLDPLVAYIHVPEREFHRIKADQSVLISIDALPGPPTAASVTRVSPIVDPATGTFKITIEIHDADGRIKPGMFGRMDIVYDRHVNVLQVPRSAIVSRTDSDSVFVVEDGVGIRKEVETGFSENGMVEIISGLTDTDKIITVGHIGLKDESKVVVINEDANVDDDGEEAEEAEEAEESNESAQ
jgi:membrane fusion protein (multidrug efflux system)